MEGLIKIFKPGAEETLVKISLEKQRMYNFSKIGISYLKTDWALIE